MSDSRLDPPRGLMRAYCQHCDRSEQIAPEEIYSPEFNFWCPQCQSILILQDDGGDRVEEPAPDAVTRVDEDAELADRRAKTKEDDDDPSSALDTSAAEPRVATRATHALEPLGPADQYDQLAAELGRGLIPDEILRPTTRVSRSEALSSRRPTERDRRLNDLLPKTWADGDAPALPDASGAAPTRSDDGPANGSARANGNGHDASKGNGSARGNGPTGTIKSPADSGPIVARETVRVTRTAIKSGATSDDDRRGSIALTMSEAIAPNLPPLPNWDGGDTQTVRELAKSDPAATSGAIPVADLGELEAAAAGHAAGEHDAEGSSEPDALDEIAVVEPTRGTTGLGSRTYEKAPVRPSDDAPTPKDGTRTTAEGSSVAPSSEAAARPAPAAASSEDLDWFALIDEALPETEGTGDADANRVVIRLPEAMAPQTEADAEQLRQLQATLEARGVSTDTHPALRLDPKKVSDAVDERTPSGDDDDDAGDLGHEQEPADDTRDDFRGARVDPDAPTAIHDPAATAAIRKELEDRNERTSSDSRIRRPLEPAPAPARVTTGRAARPKPAQVVEQFNRSDLDPALVCARDSTSIQADCFKQLYQRVFHGRARNGAPPPRTVLVTSATRGEGKTTVAANLAVVAARMPGRGALLVEADPRGGDLLRAFGVHNRAEGLLEALQSGKDPLDYVIEFKLGMLDVLPLGVPGSDAAELISSERIGETLGKLAARYPTSAIIVDGSSVLHAPDPLVLARHVDGVVLVVRADQTPREQVERACDLIGRERVLGVVLNQR